MHLDIVIIGIQAESTIAACITSIEQSEDDYIARIMYVDGRSTDKTIEIVQKFSDVEIIQNPMKHPSPGGQRNAGWLAGNAPYILFLDGDTELHPLFIKKSLSILSQQKNAHIGAVFGQRKEKHTHHSVFNWIGDIEWNPIQEKDTLKFMYVHNIHLLNSIKSKKRKNNFILKNVTSPMCQSRYSLYFGGDVMVRRAAMEVTGGYDETFIAGEDPELAIRFGINGYSIWFENIPMTVHDLGYHMQKKSVEHTKLPKTTRICPDQKTFNYKGIWDISNRAYRSGYGYAAVFWRYASKNFSDINHEYLTINEIQNRTSYWRNEVRRIAVRGCGSMLFIILSMMLFFIFSINSLQGVSSHNTLSSNIDSYTFLQNQNVFLLACALLSIILGVFLLLYPRLFSISKLMHMRKLNKKQAKIYAWYCSLIVIPQSLGLLRYFIGLYLHYPLINKLPKKNIKIISDTKGIVKSLVLYLLFCFTMILSLSSCSPRVSPNIYEEESESISAELHQNSSSFVTKAKKNQIYADSQSIESISKDLPDEYLLGAGDVLRLEVWNRPNLSDPNIVVAPDGKITIMRIGTVNVTGRTIESVIAEIESRLQYYYKKPEVRLSITTYKNNKAFVLGRVTSPGLIEFSGRGTLLEALSRAGGLPILSEQSFLTKCAIIRGKNQILWVDLRDLLQNGNMSLNARIYNNDIIFIPESQDELIYVMGEVMIPRAIQLKSEMTYLDALMFSGGPTKSADLQETFIIRFEEGKRLIKKIDLKRMLEEGDSSQNYALKDNDVVYVSETGMASFNCVMQQLLPSLEVLNLGTSVLERFGIMEQLRLRWYGTEGFVDGD